MLMDMLNKVLLILLFMSCLNVFRHAYYFTQAWVKSTSDNPKKYFVGNISLWVLSVSIAYILMSIFTGTQI
jgi:hypothetical protein